MNNKLARILFGVIIASFFLLLALAGKYVDWMWFKSLGPTTVFWVSLVTGPLSKVIVGCLIFLFFLANLLIALRSLNRVYTVNTIFPNVTKETLLIPGIAVSAIFAFILGSGLTLDWTTIQLFFNQVATGTADPIFNKDLGFYLFSYPFFRQLNQLVQFTGFLGLVGTALIYFLTKAFWKQGNFWDVAKSAKIHLTILTIFFLLTKFWGYHLGRFGLLFQETTKLTGINYTSAHARIFGFQLLSVIIIALIVVLIINIFRKGIKLFLGGLVVWILSSIIFGLVYPGIIHSFVVAPNEYEMEAPYLENHIKFTRQAYALDKIKIKSYNPNSNTATSVSLNNPSLADLRLWDYKPLNPSYNQLQSIRPYYQFNDIDIDRYPSTTGQAQVMISARELNPYRLSDQARTWINMHLTYTHGYGFAANRVNQFSDQGQPIFIARDLPPKADPKFPALNVAEPAIYFGETTDHYVIVDTKTPEFDYPQGEQNISATYHGTGGIGLNSPFNKLLMALKYQEAKFLLSPQLTPGSKILIYRNIADRVRKLAPFLQYDADPYLVVSGAKLYWIIDAYTFSSTYPYARLHESGINYLRNSVKVIIDAYNGDVNYYIIDPADPIINAWQRVFPHLFKPLGELAPDLISHFRYPEYLLTVQRDMLLQYHMTATKTFYEKEDYWAVPTYNRDEPFNPYYMTLRLPGESKPEFLMIQPFSPRGKQNLISWLVARCDQPNYGELILYTLPKDQNIYGPAQIDSRINQDENISQLITLWDQQQSKVVWGNLLIIPVEDTIIYVKPLYLESDRAQQAELKKIVIVHENQVLLGDTVAEALGGYSPGADSPAQQLPDEQSRAPVNRKSEILRRLKELSKEEQRLLDELSKY